MQTTVGQYLAKKRKRIGLTQEDLSERIKKRGITKGVGVSAISEWENDDRPIPVELYGVLSEVLEMSSPVGLFEASGLLSDLPGADIVKMLDGVSTEHLRVIHSLIKAYVETAQK